MNERLKDRKKKVFLIKKLGVGDSTNTIISNPTDRGSGSGKESAGDGSRSTQRLTPKVAKKFKILQSPQMKSLEIPLTATGNHRL